MRMETLSTAMNRLRSQGYIEDFIAAPDGELHCGACEGDCATNVEVDEIVRFEGASDPGDSAILVALHCGLSLIHIYRCPLCSGNPCCSGSPLVRHR